MSVIVKLYDHPFAPCAPSVHEAESVGHWLLSHYGPAPGLRIEVYRGHASEETLVTDLHEMQSTEPAEYTVLQYPGDGFTTFQIISFIVTAISVATQLLATPPSQPANVNRTSSSPNNSLNDRTNQVRILQRIEDIYGTVLAVPSLIAPTYQKYKNNRRVEYGYYCVGRGYYDISDVRDADTLISEIGGSSVSVYAPFTSPNSGDAPQLQIGDPIIDRVISVTKNVEIDGITLKAENQIKPASDASYTFAAASIGDTITQLAKRPNFNSIFNPGDEITIAMPDVLVSVSRSATPDATLSGFSGDFTESPDTGGGGEGAGGGGTGGSGEGGDGGG